MLKTFAVVALLLSPAAALGAELKLATWNIAWLNKDNDKGNVKRTDDDYARLRAYADRLDADVVALEEVQGAPAAKRVFDPKKYNFHFETRKSQQMVGFAIKKSVRFKNNPDHAAMSLSPGLRRGVDITITLGQTKVRLLAVHLKSGCFDNRSNAQKDCATLQRQIPILEQWIDARAIEDMPFLVIGDFNRRLDKPNDTVWAEIDDADPPNADLTDAGAGQKAECWNGKYPEYIDHIVADVRAAKMIVSGSFHPLLFDEAVVDERISDHCPVSVRLSY